MADRDGFDDSFVSVTIDFYTQAFSQVDRERERERGKVERKSKCNAKTRHAKRTDLTCKVDYIEPAFFLRRRPFYFVLLRFLTL
jgi:hypothetical protein